MEGPRAWSSALGMEIIKKKNHKCGQDMKIVNVVILLS